MCSASLEKKLLPLSYTPTLHPGLRDCSDCDGESFRPHTHTHTRGRATPGVLSPQSKVGVVDSRIPTARGPAGTPAGGWLLAKKGGAAAAAP